MSWAHKVTKSMIRPHIYNHKIYNISVTINRDFHQRALHPRLLPHYHKLLSHNPLPRLISHDFIQLCLISLICSPKDSSTLSLIAKFWIHVCTALLSIFIFGLISCFSGLHCFCLFPGYYLYADCLLVFWPFLGSLRMSFGSLLNKLQRLDPQSLRVSEQYLTENASIHILNSVYHLLLSCCFCSSLVDVHTWLQGKKNICLFANWGVWSCSVFVLALAALENIWLFAAVFKFVASLCLLSGPQAL